MNKDSINEMEQIQKGLEAFLQQEMREFESKGSGRSQAVRKDYADKDYLDEDYEDGDNDEYYDEDLEAEDDKDALDNVIHQGKDVKRTPRSQKPKAAISPGLARYGRKKKVKSRKEKTPIKEGKGVKNSKGKKRKGWKRFLFTLLLIICLLGAGWYYLVGTIYGNMNYQEITSLSGEPVKEDGVINILLIGNDSRSQGEDGRSDAMILLSVSSKTKTIHMTSLLRDMYVEIPGHQGNRLNAAYAYGGPQLLMETVEQNLDISVNRYVLVNFQAFANLVDAVGGVELELTSEEIRYVNGYLVEYNMLEGRAEGTDYMDESVSGLVHLNGPQALAYSRNRYLGTDFGRTERQRKVLSAVMKQLPKSVITNPKGLYDGLLPNLTTNLTQGECFRLSLMAGKLLTYELIQGSIPVEGTYKNASIRGMSVLEVDFEKNKEYIRSNIYGTP